MKLTSITLNHKVKPVVHPDSLDELQTAWQFLRFTHKQAVIVIVGGAGGMDEEGIARVQMFFEKHLIPFAMKKNAAIIDGGTASGVMAAMGRARNLTEADFPLIGIIARDVELIETMLEPQHTHFIFCPGSNWGDESEWIAAAASALSGSQPSLAIVINGGQITWNDARLNIQYGRPAMIADVQAPGAVHQIRGSGEPPFTEGVRGNPRIGQPVPQSPAVPGTAGMQGQIRHAAGERG